MGDFGDAERRIKGLMSEGTVFKFQGRQYKIIMSDKPTCSKGEPKTDIYQLQLPILNQITVLLVRRSFYFQ